MKQNIHLDERYARVIDLNYGPHLPDDRQARILDMGCGTGRLLAYLEGKGYGNFIGVDIDSEALAQVPANLRGRTLHVTNLSEFLVENGEQFALILAKDVLYYFHKHEVLDRMREIAQSLKPGGTIVTEVFNGALLSAPYTAAKDLGIQMLFTEQSLRSLLAGGGLEVTQVYGQLQEKQRGVRRFLYDMAVSVWQRAFRLLYLLERGADPNNPRILSKSLLAVAKRPLG